MATAPAATGSASVQPNDPTGIHRCKLAPPLFDCDYSKYEDWKRKFMAYMALQNADYTRLIKSSKAATAVLTDAEIQTSAQDDEEAKRWSSMPRDPIYILINICSASAATVVRQQRAIGDNIFFEAFRVLHQMFSLPAGTKGTGYLTTSQTKLEEQEFEEFPTMGIRCSTVLTTAKPYLIQWRLQFYSVRQKDHILVGPQLFTARDDPIKVYGIRRVYYKCQGQPVVIPYFACYVKSPIISVSRVVDRGCDLYWANTGTILRGPSLKVTLKRDGNLFYWVVRWVCCRVWFGEILKFSTICNVSEKRLRFTSKTSCFASHQKASCIEKMHG